MIINQQNMGNTETQPTIACSKLTKETLEQDVKYDAVVLVSLLLTLNIFHTLF